ncbi:hypothetical protein SK128_021587 [Halocaridina rubra]|uniref:Carbohydrate sulfotransferase n=1 Tax=Halocaridina rubra TaxID=373956 RepID=A0AAN8X771_HALRR
MNYLNNFLIRRNKTFLSVRKDHVIITNLKGNKNLNRTDASIYQSLPRNFSVLVNEIKENATWPTIVNPYAFGDKTYIQSEKRINLHTTPSYNVANGYYAQVDINKILTQGTENTNYTKSESDKDRIKAMHSVNDSTDNAHRKRIEGKENGDYTETESRENTNFTQSENNFFRSKENEYIQSESENDADYRQNEENTTHTQSGEATKAHIKLIHSEEKTKEIIDVYHISSSSPRAQLGNELERRRKRVQNICKKYSILENDTKFDREMANISNLTSTRVKPHLEYVVPSHFYLVRRKATMTCLINKVASTSLAVSLLKADGRPIPDWTEDVSPHSVVSVLKPQTQAEFNFARKYFFKFLLVRHPFERLLSAYRDKVEKANHWSLKKFRAHIKSRVKELRVQNQTGNSRQEYRRFFLKKKSSSQILRDGNVTELLDKNHGDDIIMNNVKYSKNTVNINGDHDNFLHSASDNVMAEGYSEYISENKNVKMMKGEPDNERISSSGSHRSSVYDIEHLETNGNTYKRPNYDNGTGKETCPYHGRAPGKHLRRENGDFSSHWTPYWERCAPCSLDYDIVAKFETIEDDFPMINSRLDITQQEAKTWYNRSTNETSSKLDIQRRYYSQLNPYLIGRIYRRYFMDFRLFNYDIISVYKLAGYCENDSCENVHTYFL